MEKYKIKIEGINNFYCVMTNYDDAEAVAAALVAYGKVIKGEYETDADGNYKRIGETVNNAPVVIVMDCEEA